MAALLKNSERSWPLGLVPGPLHDEDLAPRDRATEDPHVMAGVGLAPGVHRNAAELGHTSCVQRRHVALVDDLTALEDGGRRQRCHTSAVALNPNFLLEQMTRGSEDGDQ